MNVLHFKGMSIEEIFTKLNTMDLDTIVSLDDVKGKSYNERDSIITMIDELIRRDEKLVMSLNDTKYGNPRLIAAWQYYLLNAVSDRISKLSELEIEYIMDIVLSIF